MKTERPTGRRNLGLPALKSLRPATNFVHRTAFLFRYYRARQVFAQSLGDGELVSPRPECPVIVIGMHRSGTSLLAQQLEDLGVDMGKWQARNTNEAMFFRNRNQLLLSLAHASWDNPNAFLRALGNPEWRRAFVRVVARDLGTIRTLNFLPPRMLARFLPEPSQFWGFKDPRTTLTLPVWLDIFPNAKIINILRDGNAVASSLHQRGKEELQYGLPSSLVSLDPTMGLALWADYVLAAQKYCASLPQDRYLEIRYENLMREPDSLLLDVAKFIGLDADEKQVEIAASRINRTQRPVESISPVGPKAQRALALYNYL
ncbi:MAG: sulfotransferase [Woeseiaceae bacterium]